MEEILKNLNFEPAIWLVNFIGFILLYFTANKLVFVPIGKVIAERQGDIQKTYDQLDADQKQMQALKASYEAQLAAIEQEGRDRINNMIKEAQATRDSVLSDANTKAHDLISRAEAEVAREKEQAMITLRTQVADLAIGAAERVIGDNLDAARSRKLVDDFITSNGADAPVYAKASPVVAAPPVAATEPVAQAPAPVVTPTPDAKPSMGATILAGMAAAGVAAVAAVATAVKNASDDAREKAADVADNVASAVETVGDTLRGVPETAVAGAEALGDVTVTPKKPRTPRKKTDAGEPGA